MSVDYEMSDVARRYSHGRSLPEVVLARWGAVVLPLLPCRPWLRVLDLGAGTGIFTRAWPNWCRCEVVALEPAAAMRDQLVEEEVPPGVRVAAGRAEGVPLTRGSVDVAWLSAVVHHVVDLDACARELDRVVAVGGTVLIRGLFADLGRIPSLELLPGGERAHAAFPSVSEIEEAFAKYGFHLSSAQAVEDSGPSTLGLAADRIRRLRHADTLFKHLTDDEVASGLDVIDDLDPSTPLDPPSLGLLQINR